MLWAKLNPVILIHGADNFLKLHKKIPKRIRKHTVGVTLEEVLKNFKNTIPLILEMKNSALRERHWKELMDKTGKLKIFHMLIFYYFYKIYYWHSILVNCE